MAESREVIERYLQSKGIHDLLKTVVRSLCQERPEDPVAFIIGFLQEQQRPLEGEISIPPVGEETYDAAALGGPAESGSAAPPSHPTAGADQYAEEPEPDELPGETLPPLPSLAYQRKRRNAISGAPPAPVSHLSPAPGGVPMDWETRQQIDVVLHSNMLFSRLDETQLNIIMDAMQRQEAQAGEVVIKQGDQGDRFYIIATGEVEFWIAKGAAPPAKVGTAGAGQSFGELALMYGSPRAATVVATQPSVFWVMHRDTYRSILMETVLAKRRRYQDFLARVPLLSGLTTYERATLTDALLPLSFQADQVIVRQGDMGDTFYIIEEGEVVVLRQDPGQPAPLEVNRLRPPQFFGEVALLSSQHERRATVAAVNGPVRLLGLDHSAFTRLLGPLEDIMQRNTEQYHLVEGAPGAGPATEGPAGAEAAEETVGEEEEEEEEEEGHEGEMAMIHEAADVAGGE